MCVCHMSSIVVLRLGNNSVSKSGVEKSSSASDWYGRESGTYCLLCVYVCVCVCVCMCVCMYVCVCVCKYVVQNTITKRY